MKLMMTDCLDAMLLSYMEAYPEFGEWEQHSYTYIEGRLVLRLSEPWNGAILTAQSTEDDMAELTFEYDENVNTLSAFRKLFLSYLQVCRERGMPQMVQKLIIETDDLEIEDFLVRQFDAEDFV